MNVYWASQHFESLASLRTEHGLSAAADTPPFLRLVHEHALKERAEHGGSAEHRVRQIARREMRRRAF
jgi:hypothetical protein